MIVKDLNKEFHPVPKPKDKVSQKRGRSTAEKRKSSGRKRTKRRILHYAKK